MVSLKTQGTIVICVFDLVLHNLPCSAAPTCTTASVGQSLLQVDHQHRDSILYEADDLPSCARFAEWPNIDNGVTCGSCTALILASPYRGRCDEYCSSFGHVCLAAAEEEGETCTIKYSAQCNEEISGTSDILCTCGLPGEETRPEAEPEPESEDEQESAVESECCEDFASWPNIDNGVTCRSCAALVLTAPYGGSCDIYCQSFGHVCVEAAEELDENCVVKESVSCNQQVSGTSDMLCRCRLPDKGGACQAPVLSPTGSSLDDAPTPTPSESEGGGSESCCLPSDQWADVKGITCGTCAALVKTQPYGGKCTAYCESFGHVCVAAAEEQNDDCERKYSVACDVAISGTSDMLCTCSRPGASGLCQPSTLDTSTSAPSGNTQRILVSGRQLIVDGRPIHLKGVAWNPVKKGGGHPWGLDMRGFVNDDADLMQKAGINVIRTYHPITDVAVLDAFWSRGIWVVNSVYNYGRTSLAEVAEVVNAVKEHPAILMWTIGNEWNYNGLYVDMSFDDCVSRVDEVAKVVKQHDMKHPVATIYGGLHRLNEALRVFDSSIDLVGLNVYRGKEFGDMFDTYARISSKPMFLGEYGADAWDSRSGGRENQEAQADATIQLTGEINSRSAVRAGGSCIGGFVFEFADEWWKDGGGSLWEHDVGGIAPGGGPHPDLTFNEEWWGLVTIDRVPRQAFYKYAEIENPTA